ncbi:O-antigen ligase family protein [Streptomyces actinomycinicus]|uniref:O-antigen ligase family protein n=1 Tax=Streptomyces actinomycinicus TaxID=1695166 RepID=A0A937EGP0_9ACTN|nr:O-antigen ligase family protein [Streptomyces actinomycinicus]MBL1082732.1 O-antigen ligase family protein [Streptomyces actinomycinicus]
MILLGACAGWSLITAAAHDGRPEGMLLAVLAAAAGYAAGRVSGALLPVAAPGIGAAAGLALVVALPGLSPGPWYTATLGHAGATAALLVLATGAACCAAWATTAPALRLGLRALACVIVAAGAVVGAAAGCVAGAAVLLCSFAAGPARRRGAWLAGLAATAALVAGTVWAVAAKALPAGVAEPLEDRFTPHRVQLWQDALRLAGRNGGLGVGPGRFAEPDRTGARTLLSDGTPHSAPLQQAAEQGLVGVLLLVAVFCWVLYALWRTPRSTPVALTTGAALTALAALASVGNALSFTTVTAGAGLLAGWATARPWTGDTATTPAP